MSRVETIGGELLAGCTRQIAGLSRYYMLADGQVVSVFSNPKILTGGTDKDGYRKFVLINDDGVRVYVRRASLICEAFHGPRPDGMNVRHLDGTRTNDAAWNVQWATHAVNCADKVAHGTAQRGERNNLAVITEEQARFIKSRPADDWQGLSENVGCSRNIIYSIRTGRTWAWLEVEAA